MDKQNENISLSELFSYFWKKKILGLIVLIVTLVVSFVGLNVYSNLDSEYSCKFTLNWNGIEENQYPDGSRFNFKSLVSKDRLTEIRDSDPSYSNIDVEKMLAKNKVTLDKVVTYEENEIVDVEYALTLDSKLFASEAQAKAFCEDIINYQTDYVYKMVNKIKVENLLSEIKTDSEYKYVFENIEKQLGVLINTVNYFDEEEINLGLVYDVENNLIITDLVEKIQSAVNDYYFSTINLEYIYKNYVRNSETCLIEFNRELVYSTNQIKEKEAYLNSLESRFESNGNSIFSDLYLEEVMLVTKEIEDLQIRVDYLNNVIASPVENTEYEERVNQNIQRVENLSQEMNKALVALERSSVDTSFVLASVIEKVKPIELMGSVVASVGLSLVITFVVLFISAMKDRKQQEKKEEK